MKIKLILFAISILFSSRMVAQEVVLVTTGNNAYNAPVDTLDVIPFSPEHQYYIYTFNHQFRELGTFSIHLNVEYYNEEKTAYEPGNQFLIDTYPDWTYAYYRVYFRYKGLYKIHAYNGDDNTSSILEIEVK